MTIQSNPCSPQYLSFATSLHGVRRSLYIHRLLDLLLGAELVGVAALALAAVGRSRG